VLGLSPWHDPAEGLTMTKKTTGIKKPATKKTTGTVHAKPLSYLAASIGKVH
jgi:hypothetical protein